MEKFDIDPKSWFEIAKDGSKWRNLVADKAINFTSEWHKKEEEKQRKRHIEEAAKVAAAISAADASN